METKEVVVGDCNRDGGTDTNTGDAVKVPSSVTDTVDILGVGVARFWLLIDMLSILSLSPLLDNVPGLSLPAPTAPLNRLYSPLKPFWTRSPVSPLLSLRDVDGGGDANSLKVVRLSEWHAALCILSKACDNCSLSTGADPDKDAIDPRRDRRPSGMKFEEDAPKDCLGELFEDILTMVFACRMGSGPTVVYKKRAGLNRRDVLDKYHVTEP